MEQQSPPPVLRARKIRLRRGGRTLISGLDFQVSRGAVVVLEAEAGQGATSFLKVCAGLIPPDEGTVEVDGVDLNSAPYGTRREAKMKLGFVFQESALIQNLSLFDNVALPLRYHGIGSEGEVAQRVEGVLKTFDLEGAAHLRPADLGLQEAHAASLARACAMDPEILVFDDFFSRLSGARASRIWESVRSGAKGPLTALISTTDRARVPGEPTAVFVLHDGQLESGDPGAEERES